jgi:Uma2 family endonuclease
MGIYGKAMRQAPLTARRWSRVEYDRLVDLGVLDGEPVELIGGQLLVAEPQGSYHSSGVGAAADVLRAALPGGWLVRTQMPAALDDESEPEPDVAVVSGTFRDYLAGHPSRPVLIVEVSESRLAFDRADKGSLYARAGLADYWIVNLVDRVLEVYREPGHDAEAPFGWRYHSVGVHTAGASVSPLAAPQTVVRVADLLL